MEDNKKLDYLDGNPHLVNALAEFEKMIANGEVGLEDRIAYFKSMLQADINLRTRVVSAVSAADGTISTLLQLGTIVETTTGKNVAIPAGMNRAPQDVVADFSKSIEAYAEEVAPATNLAKSVNDFAAPLIHRLLLSEIAMLKLRMWYALNVGQLPNISASTLSDIVSDMEHATNGTWPSYIARMQGYSEPEWNFEKLPLSETDDLSVRSLFIWADGRELPVCVMGYVDVHQSPHGYVPIHDASLLQVVTAESTLVPVHSIGCWRVASEEEAQGDVFKTQREILVNSRTAYESVLAQAKAQEAAMLEEAKKKESGLILPEGAQGDAPKLILPN